jgi:hypothetical protein
MKPLLRYRILKTMNELLCHPISQVDLTAATLRSTKRVAGDVPEGLGLMKVESSDVAFPGKYYLDNFCTMGKIHLSHNVASSIEPYKKFIV